MTKRLLVAALALTTMALAAPSAHAIPGAAFSLGTGALFGGEDVTRTPFDGEAVLYYGLAVAKLDLGVLFSLEEPDIDPVLRPGIRLNIPGLGYLRGGLPIVMNADMNWGILAGVGTDLIDLKALKLFAEVDATFMESVNFTDVVPVEFRLGVEIGF